jgi:hypothetical protein
MVIKNNNDKQKDEDSQTVSPLNVFYTIHLMRTILILPTKKLFINKITENPISRSKYTVALTHYYLIKLLKKDPNFFKPNLTSF